MSLSFTALPRFLGYLLLKSSVTTLFLLHQRCYSPPPSMHRTLPLSAYLPPPLDPPMHRTHPVPSPFGSYPRHLLLLCVNYCMFLPRSVTQIQASHTQRAHTANNWGGGVIQRLIMGEAGGGIQRSIIGVGGVQWHYFWRG